MNEDKLETCGTLGRLRRELDEAIARAEKAEYRLSLHNTECGRSLESLVSERNSALACAKKAEKEINESQAHVESLRTELCDAAGRSLTAKEALDKAQIERDKALASLLLAETDLTHEREHRVREENRLTDKIFQIALERDEARAERCVSPSHRICAPIAEPEPEDERTPGRVRRIGSFGRRGAPDKYNPWLTAHNPERRCNVQDYRRRDGAGGRRAGGPLESKGRAARKDKNDAE